MGITIRNYTFLLVTLSTPLLVSGCGATRSLYDWIGSDSQFRTQVQATDPIGMDPGLGRRSEGLHSFLAGQLAYDGEDYETARQSFSKARELFGEGEPFLGARLAELYVREGRLEEALVESQAALVGDPDNVDLTLLHAGILAGLGRTEEAERAYEQIIAKHPQKLDPYILLVSMLLRRDDIPDAERWITRALKEIPGNPVARYYLARVHEAKGNLAQAESEYRAVFKLDPARFQGALDLIRVLLKQKRYQELRLYCEELIAQDPKNLVARRVLTQLHVGDKNIAGAVEQLQAIEALESDPTDTRFTLALLLIEQQNLREAIRELNLVLAARPTHSLARYYLASLYAGMGQRQEAIIELLKIAPGEEIYLKAQLFAAFLLRQEGDLKGAEKVARQALKADPTNENVLSYLVLVLRESKRYEAALTLLTEALKASESEKLLFSYALLLDDTGQHEASLSAMERIIEKNPKHGDALNFIAFSLAEQNKDLARAEKLIRQALASSPRDGYYLDTLGWIQFKQKDYDLAEASLEAAVTMTDGDAVIVEHLADLKLAQGDYDKARSLYERALTKCAEGGDPDVAEIAKRIRKKLAELGP